MDGRTMSAPVPSGEAAHRISDSTTVWTYDPASRLKSRMISLCCVASFTAASRPSFLRVLARSCRLSAHHPAAIPEDHGGSHGLSSVAELTEGTGDRKSA